MVIVVDMDGERGGDREREGEGERHMRLWFLPLVPSSPPHVHPQMLHRPEQTDLITGEHIVLPSELTITYRVVQRHAVRS